MRTTRRFAAWSAIVLISGFGAACATGSRYAPNDLAAVTPEERRAMRDSARAQAVADEVGPRVNISADFENQAGSRRVQATFHMYDDAYVVVGHLDAAGRLSIVFPAAPGDDGFVRGDKIYHVPWFFAGFGDEYAWRYSNYRYTGHSLAARHDSYDAGLGYVFVVASWRPMRLDRITDGNRWQTYEVSNINYMSDPREAVEELGALLAGDNREAYTIEYAHYTSTNYGTYAYSDFDRTYSSCSASSWWPAFGGYGLFFAPLGWSGYGTSLGCGNGLHYGYYPIGGYYGYAPPPSVVIPTPRPRLPLGSPVYHLPRNGGSGGVAIHRPTESGSSGSGAIVNGGSAYRRPGLITEEAAGTRGRGERRPTNSDVTIPTRRPTIQEMIGTRRGDDGFRGFTPRGATSSDDGSAWGRRPVNTGTRGADNAARWNSGGTRASGESGRSYGGQQAHASPRGGESARSEPSHSAPRGESAHAAPAHAAPSAPASHPAPPPRESSSSSSKKP